MMGPFIKAALLAALSTSSFVRAAPDTGKNGAHNNLARDLRVLQKFASTITYDPYDHLSNWTAAGDNVCDFAGVICDSQPGYLAVIGIDFNKFRFGEDLHCDSLIYGLEDLFFYHGNSNNCSRHPPNIEKAPKLYELDLSNNNLTGHFPHSFLSEQLGFLDLRFNHLSGKLPEKLFDSTYLDVLFLNNNQFEGRIPKVTKTLRTIYLTLANNRLTGEIPASLANSDRLTQVLFSNNDLEGGVPEELCALKTLHLIDVSGNPKMKGYLGPACLDMYKSADRALAINGTQLIPELDPR